jgi:hypothetical protein
MSAPILIDLCCGRGGWAKGAIEEGYRAIGFDLNPNFESVYPGEFVCGDVRVLLRDMLDRSRPESKYCALIRQSALICASPPCEEFSRHQMPWTKRRNPPEPDLSVVKACWEIATAAGRPMVLENVRMAQRWLGTARWHSGPFYLWGDVPAIMPRLKYGSDRHDPNSSAIRQKQTMSSSRRAERAEVPFELAQHIAAVFRPADYNREMSS